MLEELERLRTKALHILTLEINNLQIEVGKGKLGASGKDLVAYIKLLNELVDLQKKAAKDLPALPQEELERLVRELIEKK
jgi:hypothetical protein